MRTMRSIFEAAEWKKGDPVPDGYMVVFGKLAKVGGSGKAGTSNMDDSDPRDGARFFDISKEKSIAKKLKGPNAKKAAADINKTIQKMAGWVAKNADTLNSDEYAESPEETAHFRKNAKMLDDLYDRVKDSGIDGDDIQDLWLSASERALRR